jgi:hypothetical protein
MGMIVQLLVDHLKGVSTCNKIGVDVNYISAVYTCVFQQVYVGFNAPFKWHSKDSHPKWCIGEFQML